jgi:hypothetical protein
MLIFQKASCKIFHSNGAGNKKNDNIVHLKKNKKYVTTTQYFVRNEKGIFYNYMTLSLYIRVVEPD